MSPLQQALGEYQKCLNPERCERGASRAVAIEELSELQEHFQHLLRQRNMHYVVDSMVKPVTKPWQVSFAEVAGHGPVEFFVSDVWATPFCDFMACLRSHAPLKSTRYWHSAFSANQWYIENEVGGFGVEESDCYLALMSPTCMGTCAVVPNVNGLGQWLNRAWCVFEMFLTFRAQTEAFEAGRIGHEGLLFCAASGTLNHGKCSFDICMSYFAVLKTTDFMAALAVGAQDKQIIVDLIVSQMGSLDRLVEVVKNSLYAAIASIEDNIRENALQFRKQVLLERFAKDLLHDNPHPIRCLPGESRAINVGRIEAFRGFFSSVLEDRNMYWVCDELVKPLTETRRMSFAEVVGCGRVAWFVSHYWGMRFNETVTSIVKHAQLSTQLGCWEDVRYWVCTLSNNQWATHEESWHLVRAL